MAKESKYFTFGELEVGDKFIALPVDGDDHGHGGWKGLCWIFVKKANEK